MKTVKRRTWRQELFRAGQKISRRNNGDMKLNKLHSLRLKLFIFWLVVIALFTGYGFYTGGNVVYGDRFYWSNAIHDAIGLAAFGVTVATLIAVGTFAIVNVRSYGLGKGRAVSLIATSLIISIIFPPIVAACTGLFGSGDDALFLPSEIFLSICTSVVGFAALALYICFARRKTTISQD
ncbi:MAG TPA: hypothetical protein VGM58_00510 [Verrucomicrobiae bacterium]